MSTATRAAQMANPPKRWIWSGRLLSAIPILLLTMSAAFAFARTPQVVEGMAKFGYRENTLLLIALLELGSALLYAIPRTAVLGAIVMTGYLGGAVATHVRIGDPGYPLALVMGIFVWARLVPARRAPPRAATAEPTAITRAADTSRSFRCPTLFLQEETVKPHRPQAK